MDLLLQSDWKGWADGTYLYNNIFYVEGRAQFSYGISRAADGAYTTAPGFGESQHNRFDSNVYFGNIVAASDPHALLADPKFVAPDLANFGRLSASGYHLLPGSPAEASGKFISQSGGRDYWGTAVPSCGKTDRGASQSQDCFGARSFH